MLPETLRKIVENRMVNAFNHNQMFQELSCAVFQPGRVMPTLTDYARQIIKLQGGESTVETFDFWLKYLQRLHRHVDILQLTNSLQNNPMSGWTNHRDLHEMSREFAEDREAMFYMLPHAA